MEWYSLLHIIILVLFVLSIVFIITFHNRLSKKADKYTRKIGAFALLSLEFILMIVRFSQEPITASLLPLHLCTISMFCIAYSLLDFNPKFFKIVMYWAIFGPFLSIFFPFFTGGADTYRFYNYFFEHILTALLTTYLFLREKIETDKKTFIMSMAINLVIALIIVMPINHFFNTNFMFLSSTPKQMDFIFSWAGSFKNLILMFLIFICNCLTLLYFKLLTHLRKKIELAEELMNGKQSKH